MNVEVIGDHHVIDDGLEHLVDFALRRDQADLLQAINHVDLSLPFPGALGFDGGSVLGFLTLVLDRLRSVDGDLGELRAAAEILQVIAPEPRLRLVMERLTDTVFEIGLLGINKRRQPHAGAKVLPPAVKVQIITGSRMRIVSAVEANDVVVLIFDPDAAEEPALAGVFLGGDVHDDAAYFPKELAADESVIVIPALEILIEDHHLGKAQGQELHGIYVAQLAEHAFTEPGCGRRGEGAVIGTLAHI